MVSASTTPLLAFRAARRIERTPNVPCFRSVVKCLRKSFIRPGATVMSNTPPTMHVYVSPAFGRAIIAAYNLWLV
jgi:hypothetical protein